MKQLTHILSIFLLALSCSEDDPNPNTQPFEPAVTEVGIPTGTAVTKEIGPSGGSIASDDGILNVIVPAGAVNANTTFSVQPITNFCPGGMLAYRLLPEGLTFTNQVTLVFHYTDKDISGTLPELLGIAYQGEDKIWYSLPDALVDEGNKTISVQARHFTDWTAIEHLRIYPTSPEVLEVRENATKDLNIIGQGMFDGEEDELPPLPPNPNPDPPCANCDDLPPLPSPRPFKAKLFVNSIEGGNDNVGTIEAQTYTGGALQYTYKAPAKVPAGNPVMITAEIEGLKYWTLEGGKLKVAKKNKVVLFKQIKIIPNEYHYHLKVEYKDPNCCAFGGQLYYDVAEMDVHVVDLTIEKDKITGGTVTIDNVVNHAPTVNPPTVEVPGTNCTFTFNPGSTGTLNVASGTGGVHPPMNEGDHPRFYVLISSKEIHKGQVQTLECPDSSPVTGEATPFDGTDGPFEFDIHDEPQQKTSFGYVLTLTPK